MTEALPKGLVTNTDHVSSELDRTDHVDQEDLAKLWRVYTTNKSTLSKDTGKRLENLFWRIWSNNHIKTTITGSTLARLFVQMSETCSVDVSFPSRISVSTSSVATSKGSSRTCLSRKQSGNGSPLPPSILKKSRATSENPPKSARFLFTVVDGQDGSYSSANGSISPELDGQGMQKRDDLRRSMGTFATRSSYHRSRPSQRSPKFDGGSPAALPPPLLNTPFHPVSRDSSKQQISQRHSPSSLDYQIHRRPPRSHPSPNYLSTPDSPSAISPRTRPPPQLQPLSETVPAQGTVLVDPDFRTRFVKRQFRESRNSSLTSLSSSLTGAILQPGTTGRNQSASKQARNQPPSSPPQPLTTLSSTPTSQPALASNLATGFLQPQPQPHPDSQQLPGRPSQAKGTNIRSSSTRRSIDPQPRSSVGSARDSSPYFGSTQQQESHLSRLLEQDKSRDPSREQN